MFEDFGREVVALASAEGGQLLSFELVDFLVVDVDVELGSVVPETGVVEDAEGDREVGVLWNREFAELDDAGFGLDERDV